MTPPVLFVTGTDTGVGKTTIACGLLAAWRGQGRAVAVMKPAETGCARDASGALVGLDTTALADAAGLSGHEDLVGPFRYERPVAPAVAARTEGHPVDLQRLLLCRRELERIAPHELLVVEGAGGLLVPFTERLTAADVAKALGARLLVIARAGLGTINHTVLTVEAARARGLDTLGVILSRTSRDPDPSEPDNPAEISRLTGVPVLGTVSHVSPMDGRAVALALGELATELWRRATTNRSSFR
jgi:dethiobiotin synthetase